MKIPKNSSGFLCGMKSRFLVRLISEFCDFNATQCNIHIQNGKESIFPNGNQLDWNLIEIFHN